MSKVIISEGRTTNEAIEKGLKELNTSREKVEIKILDQEKRSFFDILAPRVVKVEITLKEEKKEEPIDNITEQDLKCAILFRSTNFIIPFFSKASEKEKG